MMMPDRFDHIYLQTMQERERKTLDEWMGNDQAPQPTPPPKNKPIEEFLTGVGTALKSVWETASQPVEQQPDIMRRVGDTLGAALSLPYTALAQGLQDAGAITPEFRKNLDNSLMGAMPAFWSPKGPMDMRTLLKEKPAGKVRVTPEGAAPEGTPPTGPNRINLDRVSAPDTVKRTMARVNELTAEQQAKARKPVSHTQTIAESTKSKLTLEEALNLPDEYPLDRSDQLRVRDYHNAAAKHLQEVKELAKAGDEAARAELFDAFTVASRLSVVDEGVGRAYARGLESRKILSEGERVPFNPGDLVDAANRMRGANVLEPDTIISLLDTMEKPTRDTFLVKSGHAMRNGASLTRDVLYELYYDSLLSGPKTLVRNAVGNAMTTLWAIPERAVTAMIPGGDVGIAEAAAMTRGVVQGFMDGVGLGHKLEIARGSKLERTPAISAERFGVQNDTLAGKAIDWTGSALRIGPTAMEKTDTFFKAVNGRMEAKAQAARQASVEGLKWGTPEFAERVRYIEDHIEQFGSLWEATKDFQLVQTFQNELGEVGKALEKLRAQTPGGKVVIPFMKTGGNIITYGTHRLFPLNVPSMLWGQLGEEIAATGTRRQIALGKVATGAMFTGAMALVAAGGYLTGGGPRDPDLKRQRKEAGWQPYALKLGDTYYSLNGLDPQLGFMLGTVADTVEIMAQLPDWQADALAMTLVRSVSNNVVSKTWMTGLREVLEAVTDPNEANIRGLQRAAARSVTPALARQVKQETDPTMREARGFVDEIRANLPGFSDAMPPRRNFFGEAMDVPPAWGPDWLSPITTTVDKKSDLVAKEIERNKVDVGMPPKILFGRRPPDVRMEEPRVGEGYELSAKQYSRFCELRGNGSKGPDGKGMRDALYDEMTRESWKTESDGPDGGKALIVKRIASGFLKQARAELMDEYPEIQQFFDAQQLKRERALEPKR